MQCPQTLDYWTRFASDQASLVLQNLTVELDQDRKAVWIRLHPKERPSFTFPLLEDLVTALNWIEVAYHELADGRHRPFSYVITKSEVPGIFNLGGDLPLFISLIREGNREELRRYAHLCIDIQHRRFATFDLPLINISLVQGDALGGGFEYALADDVIIAEKSAKLGFPECRFNLFPGMGAYSFVSRRLGLAKAQEFTSRGRLYSGGEMHDLGIVDVQAEDGKGEEALDDHLRELDKYFNSRQAIHRTRRLVAPVDKQELLDVTDLWVETALQQSDKDLRKMRSFAVAQDRVFGSLVAAGWGSYVIANTQAETERLSDQSNYFAALTERLLREAGPRPGAQCLDVGFGSGDVSRFMGDIVGEKGSVTGIEINEAMGRPIYQELDRALPAKFHFVHGEVEHLTELPAEGYDFVFARFLLLHMEDPVTTLRRLWRWTKPGGSLLVMDYDFRRMGAEPEHAAVTDLKRVITGVLQDADLDPELGHKIPVHFDAAGIGSPDAIDVFEARDRIVNLRKLLRATYDSFLPSALASELTTQEVAERYFEEMDQLADNDTTDFILPSVISAWKRKPDVVSPLDA